MLSPVPALSHCHLTKRIEHTSQDQRAHKTALWPQQMCAVCSLSLGGRVRVLFDQACVVTRRRQRYSSHTAIRICCDPVCAPPGNTHTHTCTTRWSHNPTHAHVHTGTHMEPEATPRPIANRRYGMQSSSERALRFLRYSAARWSWSFRWRSIGKE